MFLGLFCGLGVFSGFLGGDGRRCSGRRGGGGEVAYDGMVMEGSRIDPLDAKMAGLGRITEKKWWHGTSCASKGLRMALEGY